MGVQIVRGTNQKHASSSELYNIFSDQIDISGQLFIGYPIIGTSEGPHVIDALLVSPDKGIVIFDLIEGSDTSYYDARQDDSANKVEAKLRPNPGLVRRRDLLVQIHTISFAPGVYNLDDRKIDDYPIANKDTLVDEVRRFKWEAGEQCTYETALSVIESISALRQSRTRRTIKKDDSRGAKLKRLEDSISTLDNLQSKAVIETVDDVQRIRGLAGSGKTIVLALKAAYLHAQHPDWRIAVTFNTRSLKEYFRRLITNFTLEQTSAEPDWENLRVLNAWGAPGRSERDGIYHEFCRAHNIEYLDFRSARRTFPGREFERVCALAIEQISENKPIYDAILVDEAQDLPSEFLRLCYEFLKTPKRLVYAYDELQSLTGKSLPPPEQIFGTKENGEPKVTLNPSSNNPTPRRDIILEKCYRNSRPVLVTAHALGFGIYREPPAGEANGLVQMFDYPQLWEEIGYERKEGELKERHSVTLRRTGGTSPEFLENHSDTDDLVKFVCFDSDEEQARWLAEAIEKDLSKSELRHNDIIVINPDPSTTRTKVGLARRFLFEMNINSHLAGVDTEPDVFFNEDSVTFTGIFRAQGNEAGMVYTINAQDCHSSKFNLATKRNQLFTAITRSKAWVRVLGIGDGMKKLIKEYEELKTQDFELKFAYPTEDEREQLRIVHRDMSPSGHERLETTQKNLDDLIGDIELGNLHIEDLNADTIDKLRAFIGNG